MATVSIIKGRLYYDFYYKGVRCTEAVGLEATKENRKQAEKFMKLVAAEIDNGVFEYERHFPYGTKIELFSPGKVDLPFNQYFADWMAGKVLKETTPTQLGECLLEAPLPVLYRPSHFHHYQGRYSPVPEDYGGQGAKAQHHQ